MDKPTASLRWATGPMGGGHPVATITSATPGSAVRARVRARERQMNAALGLGPPRPRSRTPHSGRARSARRRRAGGRRAPHRGGSLARHRDPPHADPHVRASPCLPGRAAPPRVASSRAAVSSGRDAAGGSARTPECGTRGLSPQPFSRIVLPARVAELVGSHDLGADPRPAGWRRRRRRRYCRPRPSMPLAAPWRTSIVQALAGMTERRLQALRFPVLEAISEIAKLWTRTSDMGLLLGIEPSARRDAARAMPQRPHAQRPASIWASSLVGCGRIKIVRVSTSAVQAEVVLRW